MINFAVTSKLEHMNSSIIIGRQKEREELWRCYNSDRSEFAIVYGRRRIGKTFLVYETFKNQLSFYFTGSHKSSEDRQLKVFASQLRKFGNTKFEPVLHSWYDAFDALQEMLEKMPTKKRKVIFFDEMPWIDTYKSDFMAAFEDFWNIWANQRHDICLFACGSSTSWMVNRLVKNQGGLHNRITSTIYLRPFNLRETEEYLLARKFTWDRYSILQCYMYLGGVPFYLSLLQASLSLAQNIDRLIFQKGAQLHNEFDELYDVLFNKSENYKSIVRALASRRDGMTRKELEEKTGISGGTLSTILCNLEDSDFIISYKQFGNKKKGSIFRITDFFTLFHFKFIENNNNKDSHYWEKHQTSQSVISWQGVSYELVCLTHLDQIKKAIGISVIECEASAWRSNDKNIYLNGTDKPKANAQIDLLISRADRIINICEIKFSTDEYLVSNDYEEKLRRKMSVFKAETNTKKTLILTFITTYGVIPNLHSGIIQKQIVMNDLFTDNS